MMMPPDFATEFQPKIKGKPGVVRGQSRIMIAHNDAWIELTDGDWCVIAAGDIALINFGKWHTLRTKKILYGYRNHPYAVMHRVIMGAQRGVLVDHIDGNGLNNRRSNLRLCSMAENQRNRIRLASNNTSGVTGVHWIKGRKQWRARLRIHDNWITLGCFHSIDDAIRARREGEQKYFGDFAPIQRTAE